MDNGKQFDNEFAKLRAKLNILEERRDNVALKTVGCQRRAACYYNAKVKGQSFNIDNLVLQKVTLNTKEPRADSLGLSWEKPYKVVRIVGLGTYNLKDLNGRVLKQS